jgi:hypothetical protein
MSRQRSVAVVFLGGMTLAGCAMFGVSRGETGTDDFDAAVRPILVGTCAQCHDGRLQNP